MAAGVCARRPWWDGMPTAEQLLDCSACPVRDACLDYALTAEYRQEPTHVAHYPVYGGLTGRQRARLVAAARRARQAPAC